MNDDIFKRFDDLFGGFWSINPGFDDNELDGPVDLYFGFPFSPHGQEFQNSPGLSPNEPGSMRRFMFKSASVDPAVFCNSCPPPGQVSNDQPQIEKQQQSGFSFSSSLPVTKFSKSVIVKKHMRPDGIMEETRTVKDNTGTNETTVTYRDRDGNVIDMPPSPQSSNSSNPRKPVINSNPSRRNDRSGIIKVDWNSENDDDRNPFRFWKFTSKSDTDNTSKTSTWEWLKSFWPRK